MKTKGLLFFVFTFLFLFFSEKEAMAQSFKTITSKHYRVHFAPAHEDIAIEVLEIAELVWPTLAKAYDAYERYQVIDIAVRDPGDMANGWAISDLSLVEVWVEHLNWVVRGRRNWLANVLTHELTHIFSLRRTAYLSALDEARLFASTYNERVNYAFNLFWKPLVAPTWFVEGIAQLEAEEHGYDMWDSQRDMLMRDAYLTGTYPSLGLMEHFDGDWLFSERVYNSGYSFLRFLRDEYGIEKVRELAKPKPIFNFSYSVKKVFGKNIEELHKDWKRALARTYQEFEDKPQDKLFRSTGSFDHSLAFSPDGRYIAWIGNDGRDAPMNWIYWEEQATQKQIAVQIPRKTNINGERGKRDGLRKTYTPLGILNAYSSPVSEPYDHSTLKKHDHKHCGLEHKKKTSEYGAVGLEFHPDSKRLLTTRAEYSPYRDLWEYNIFTETWTRLTWQERASDPSYSKNGSKVVFARHRGGSSNIAVLDTKGRIVQYTNFKEGQQVYNPRFNPSSDSIYFTYGVGGDEAIVSLPVDMPTWDPIESIKDSANFPDSLNLPESHSLTYITGMDAYLDRDLFFVGDTLVWSSHYQNGVYNVYAKPPESDQVYRVTDVKTQALQPIVYQKQLYYQGYQKQEFSLYTKPFELVATNISLNKSNENKKEPRKKEHLDLKKSKDISVGNGVNHRKAWEIVPYLALRTFVADDSTLYNSASIGASILLGTAFGVDHRIGGAISKDVDIRSRDVDWYSPLDYNVEYEGTIVRPTIKHKLFSWTPRLNYSLEHYVYNVYNDATYRGDTISSPIAGGDVLFDGEVEDRVTHTRNVVSTSITLPWSFYNSNRYLKHNRTYIYSESGDAYNIGDTTLTTPFSSKNNTVIENSEQMHQHFTGLIGWQKASFKKGTIFPTGIFFNGYVQKWWATYGSGVVQDPCLEKEDACGLNRWRQSLFDPWEIGGNLVAFYSLDKMFTLRSHTEWSMLSQTIPTLGYGTELLTPNLYYVYRNLGAFRLQAYPYSFSYKGRDIMRGNALWTTGVQLEVPFKLRKYISSYWFPFSSLNQVKVTAMANMGGVLNERPSDIWAEVKKASGDLWEDLSQQEENSKSSSSSAIDALYEVGMRFSLNFQVFHRYPMTCFFSFHKPINTLKARYVDVSLTEAESNSDDADKIRAERQKNALNQFNEMRFYLGVSLGRF